VEKIINISGKDVRFKATAGTLARYRMYFKRDLLKDLMKLSKKLEKIKDSEEQFEMLDLEVFEYIAWTMAKTADNNIPALENWLDDFETFSIIQILPEIIQLMTDNMSQENESKKKLMETVTEN